MSETLKKTETKKKEKSPRDPQSKCITINILTINLSSLSNDLAKFWSPFSILLSSSAIEVGLLGNKSELFLYRTLEFMLHAQ